MIASLPITRKFLNTMKLLNANDLVLPLAKSEEYKKQITTKSIMEIKFFGAKTSR